MTCLGSQSANLDHVLWVLASGYNLTFRAPKDTSPQIIDDDVPNFSHVILFTPETKSK